MKSPKKKKKEQEKIFLVGIFVRYSFDATFFQKAFVQKI